MIRKCDGGGRCPSQGCSANTCWSSRGNTLFNTKTAGNLCLWSIWLVKNRYWLKVMTMRTRPRAPILPWSQPRLPLLPTPSPALRPSLPCAQVLPFLGTGNSSLCEDYPEQTHFKSGCQWKLPKVRVYIRMSVHMCCGRRSTVSLKHPLNLTLGNGDGYLWSGPGRRPTTAKVCVPPTITLYCWTRKQHMPSLNPKT